MADSPAARSYAEGSFPSRRTPWREAGFVVVDLELTGLDPATDEIVSFAAIPVEGGTVRVAGMRHGLVRPERMPGGETIRIHGLREADLADAPPLDRVLDALLEALTGRVLVAHSAGIETGFLGAALQRAGVELRNPVVDTARLGSELARLRQSPESPEGLGDLARWLGLPAHSPHRAEGDALTTAQVLLALATHLEAFESVTVGSLVRISRPPRRRLSLRALLGRFGLERFRR
jgi:DNA polymerase-3 subunit epsilon